MDEVARQKVALAKMRAEDYRKATEGRSPREIEKEIERQKELLRRLYADD